MNFKDSFGKGLNAAAEAQSLISEIDSVFTELDKQIIEASDGKISIYRRETYEAIESDSMSGVVGSTIFEAAGLMKRRKITGIFAKNPNSEEGGREIGKVRIDKRGYPCEIRFSGESFVCEDKKSLEKALNYLLADVDVGKTLSKLINLKPAENPAK